MQMDVKAMLGIHDFRETCEISSIFAHHGDVIQQAMEVGRFLATKL
jgi:hypothetical protein